MNSPSQNREPSTLSVVVGLGFTDADHFAFEQAAVLAKRVAGSELHLVHVFSHAHEVEDARARELISHLRLYVNEKSASLGGLKAMTVAIHLRAGKPVREIVQIAADVRAGLIVVGAHEGPSVKSWLLGTTAERLAATAPCPVVIAGPKPKAALEHEPAIEPPCPDCERARATSQGANWWCERHSRHAARAHTFSYRRELPFAMHDSEVIPTGIDL